MRQGAHRFIERKIEQAASKRASFWRRDLSSPEAYERSVEPNRKHFARIIGLADKRVEPRLERFCVGTDDNTVTDTCLYRAYQVRWPVLADANGVPMLFGEGLLLEPKKKVAGCVVALPDADQTPEQVVGLAQGVAPASQFARRLAESGFEVLVPALVSRGNRFCGSVRLPRACKDQTHREWIYRQAFHMGRHVIGYEVQKVLSAIDWFEDRYEEARKIGVVAYGEGGLVAFHAAAADPRVDAVLVSGYFDSRQGLWSEPLSRTVWGILREFGDAEIATLIAPRGLVVEHSSFPEFDYGKGRLATPEFAVLRGEFERIEALVGSEFQRREIIANNNGTTVPFGSPAALQAFGRILGTDADMGIATSPPVDRRREFDADARQERQVREMEYHVQALVETSEDRRDSFYPFKVMPELEPDPFTNSGLLDHETFSAERFAEGSEAYRRYCWEEVFGVSSQGLPAAVSRVSGPSAFGSGDITFTDVTTTFHKSYRISTGLVGRSLRSTVSVAELMVVPMQQDIASFGEALSTSFTTAKS